MHIQTQNQSFQFGCRRWLANWVDSLTDILSVRERAVESEPSDAFTSAAMTNGLIERFGFKLTLPPSNLIRAVWQLLTPRGRYGEIGWSRFESRRLAGYATDFQRVGGPTQSPRRPATR